MSRSPSPSPSTHVRSLTIRDVSREAGVSTATVSRVLAGLGGASASTCARIQDVVARLGYRPNRMARDLRATRSRLIGVVIPDLQNPFFTGVVAGIEDELHAAGFSIFLANSDEDLERERQELSTLSNERLAGLLLIPCHESAPHYEQLGDMSEPVVTIDREVAGSQFDHVTTANEAGAFAAVNHLFEAGCDGVGLVNGPARFGVAREREAGYRSALKKHGVRSKRSWMGEADFREDGGYVAASKILRQTKRPRALFVANFLMALGALRAIHERNLRIPEDVALITYDDMPWAAAMKPALSTVAQPVKEIGRAAARLLLERLERPDLPPRRVVLDTRLVVRESCGVA